MSSRRGFESIHELVKPGCELWLDAGVARKTEVDALRNRGIGVTTFSHPPLRGADDFAYALKTIVEHHPGEVIWMEHRADATDDCSSI